MPVIPKILLKKIGVGRQPANPRSLEDGHQNGVYVIDLNFSAVCFPIVTVLAQLLMTHALRINPKTCTKYNITLSDKQHYTT